jgi:hypothetical protein
MATCYDPKMALVTNDEDGAELEHKLEALWINELTPK